MPPKYKGKKGKKGKKVPAQKSFYSELQDIHNELNLTFKPINNINNFVFALEELYTMHQLSSCLKQIKGDDSESFSLENKQTQADKDRNILNDDSKILKKFLENRWQRIKGTAKEYTEDTNSEANRFCIRIAKLLEKELKKDDANNNYFQLLMPTINGQLFDSINAQTLTETLADNATRQSLKSYVVGANYTTLINVNDTLLSFYEGGTKNDDIFIMQHPLYDTTDNKPLHFTEAEIDKIKSHMPECDAYYNSICERIEFMGTFKKGSALPALRALTKGLRDGGSSQSGEAAATTKAFVALVEFRRYLDSLDDETRNELMQLRHGNNTLDSIWHNRLSSAGALRGGNSLPCVESSAYSLEQIITSNLAKLQGDDFAEVKLLSTKTNCEECKKRLEQTTKNNAEISATITTETAKKLAKNLHQNGDNSFQSFFATYWPVLYVNYKHIISKNLLLFFSTHQQLSKIQDETRKEIILTLLTEFKPDHLTEIKALLTDLKKHNVLNSYINATVSRSWGKPTALFEICRTGNSAAHVEFATFLLKNGANANFGLNADNWSCLHEACKYNHEKIVEVLLKHGVSPETKWNNKSRNGSETPLHTACWRGKLNAARILLNNKADINAKNGLGQTALHYAAENRHVETTKFLLEHNADINAKNNAGETALIIAAKKSNIALVRLLISKKASINTGCNSNNTALYQACRNGNLKVVELLLEHGADINTVGELGTALCAAISYAPKHHMECIKAILAHNPNLHLKKNNKTALGYARDKKNVPVCELLEKIIIEEIFTNLINCNFNQVKSIINNENIDPNCVIDRGWGKPTLLFEICRTGNSAEHAELAEFLLAKGANANFALNADGWNCIQEACKYDHDRVIKVLLNRGVSPEAIWNDKGCNGGTTPLHTACWNGNLHAANVLIANKANINARNGVGETPLHYAVINTVENAGKEKYDSYLKLIKTLLAKNADANIPGRSNITPLHHACWHGQKAIVELLLATKNIDVNKQNEFGQTPLLDAVQKGYIEIAKMLIEHGANINAKNNAGETALFMAVKNLDVNLVKFLLTKKPDLEISNKAWGATPLNLAAHIGNLEIVTSLINAKANVNTGNHSNNTPLYHACWNGHSKVTKLLLQHGANVNASGKYGSPICAAIFYAPKDHMTCIQAILAHNPNLYLKKNNKSALDYARDKNNQAVITLLEKVLIGKLCAAATNDENIEEMKLIIEQEKFAVDSKNDHDESALSLAISHDATENIRYLIAAGANILETSNGKTPLEQAIEHGNNEIIDIIRAKERQAFSHKLLAATTENNTDAAQACFAHNPDLEFSLANGMTALHYAAQNNNVALASSLISNGANVLAKDENGSTPLDLTDEVAIKTLLRRKSHLIMKTQKAIVQKNIGKLRKILNKHPELLSYQCYDKDRSIFHLVCERGNLKSILLIEEMLGENFSSTKKLTPNAWHPKALFRALLSESGKLQEDISLIQKLLDFGADPNNIVDVNGNGPLHLAARRGHTETALTLINIAHATINSRNNKTETPEQVACRHHKYSTANLLGSLYQKHPSYSALFFSAPREVEIQQANSLENTI